MLKLLLVDNDQASLTMLADELEKGGRFSVNWAYSKESALDFLDKDRPQVIVIGEELSGESSLEFVKELIRRDPFINCALVSSLSPGNFHEKTEGLGVFMQLPAHPGAEEAGRMVGLLEAIGMPVGKA